MGRFIDPSRSRWASLSAADRLVLLATVIVGIATSIISTPDDGAAVAFLPGCFAQGALVRWQHSKDPRAPMLAAIVAAVQLPAIFLVHIGKMPFAIVSLLLTLPECVALWLLLNWMDRRFPRHVDDLSLLEGIARGEEAINDGRVVSDAEARSRMTRWLK